ncbi:hypothetical protein D4764_01G0003450 [Takifugu flavidus]|uniref:Uncharacterized protein n=1 Tax=Takifugu flavidus TaxID=433684 RepID=A0A5C6PQH3_9TELE|nr:hypothetical protein D4764_01G0003450 [Takifugu flavidus]
MFVLFFTFYCHIIMCYRIDSILVKSPTSVKRLLGLIESWSMFQTLKNNDPQRAEDLLMKTQKRFLDEMGATSLQTEIVYEIEYFCILASKPG